MSLRKRIIGRCGAYLPSPEAINVDVGLVLRRLLLFDTFILDTIKLLEVPALVETFGARGLTLLLDSGAIRILFDPLTVGQTGQLATELRQQKGTLPLSSYCLSTVSLASKDEFLTMCLQNVHKASGANRKDLIKLKQMIASTIISNPLNAGEDALRAVPSDLERADYFPALLRRAVTEMLHIDIPEERIRTHIHRLDDRDFRVESNLSNLIGIDAPKAHSIQERAILAAADLNMRIEEMRNHNALSGVLDEDAPVLGRKLDFLARAISPQQQDQHFVRVVDLAGLPTNREGIKIDVERLLEVRASRECREFRQWLQGIASPPPVL